MVSSLSFFIFSTQIVKSQIYTPEINVTNSGNSVEGSLTIEGLTIGKYHNSLAGDPSPWRISAPPDVGTHDLNIYGSSSNATLNLRLQDGDLKIGDNEVPYGLFSRDGITINRNKQEGQILISSTNTSSHWFFRNDGYAQGKDESGNKNVIIRTYGDSQFLGGKITSQSFVQSSDIRLKKEIKKINDIVVFNNLLSLDLYSFKYKSSSSRQLGVIAQDVIEFFPELVETDNNGFFTVN